MAAYHAYVQALQYQDYYDSHLQPDVSTFRPTLYDVKEKDIRGVMLRP